VPAAARFGAGLCGAQAQQVAAHSERRQAGSGKILRHLHRRLGLVLGLGGQVAHGYACRPGPARWPAEPQRQHLEVPRPLDRRHPAAAKAATAAPPAHHDHWPRRYPARPL
nr:hypothetical protein [Tanacetum cinerariifolium]